MLDRRGFLTISETDLDSIHGRCFRDELLFDGVIVIVNDLDRGLKLIDLCLQKLLCNRSQVIEAELDEATLHYLLAELNRLLLSFLNNLPELVREGISALV